MRDGSLRQVYKEVEEPLDSKCGVIALITIGKTPARWKLALCGAEPLHLGGSL